ncbi:MAG TPA: NAD(P)/FAD-dependent oxidoreductase, partial [Patescibacteria group bacterium]|nr:NAD(P)/FAD-dependent oxidoreductase [Patescibacteria group bacterium]
MKEPVSTEVDVAIVGAGPAGCAAAMALRRQGRTVALLEKARFPRDKICGDFLTPGCVARLQELGSEEVEAVTPTRLRGMRITFDGTEVLSDFPPARHGWSMSRRSLDAALARRASMMGACLVEELRVENFGREEDGWQWIEGSHPDGARRRWRARLLVEAGGRHGLIGRRLGWRNDDPRLTRYALWSHMENMRGLGDRGEMHVFDGGYVGVAPLQGAADRGLANVTMVLTASRWSRARADIRGYFLDLLRSHPELGRRVADAGLVTPLRGIGPLACSASRLTGDGLAMVGDACGFVDPFTGEGIFMALESARLMAEAVAAGSLDRYESAWRAAFSSKLRLCRLLQIVIARPWLARYVARALGSRKDLADRMVGATGDLFPASSVL